MKLAGALLLAGVDEVGRGPLAGPVTAAAVVLDPRRRVNGLRDSKQLTAARRELLAGRICDRALAWSVAWSDPAEIDSINIFQATLLAMRRALQGLSIDPSRVQFDGRHTALPPGMCCEAEAVVGGDARCRAISAASIIAKVHRDRVMCELDAVYPQYGFAAHKGYATGTHLRALTRYGPTPLHRVSFAPVRAAQSRR